MHQRDQPNGFMAEPDIMDTWATSSLTPQIVTKWAEPGEENERFFKSTFPMDLRPQGQDIIRTWLFSTIDRADLENHCLPWANATLSGWILDPDHKKMSKSKGNVVVPNKPIEQFGADAVRYWAASARLGLDATYDEGQMKIGRRLAIKLLNATKFALAIGREDENHHVGEGATASWDPKDVTEPLDRAAMAKMAKVVYDATESLNNYEHSKALETIEDFFWQFCDDYIELVKNRAYGTAESTGVEPSPQAVKSARTTLGLGLDAFARLLAPFLPYTTEEVWSWMHAGEGSVHHAPWPKPITYATAAFKASPELLTQAGAALTTAWHQVEGQGLDEDADPLGDAQRERRAARRPGAGPWRHRRGGTRHRPHLTAEGQRPHGEVRPSEGRGHGSTGPGIGRDGRRGDHRGRKRARRATGQETEGRAVSANPGNEMREGMSMCLPHFVFRRRHGTISYSSEINGQVVRLAYRLWANTKKLSGS